MQTPAYDESYLNSMMADIYTCMQWKYGILSELLVKTIKPKELYQKYYPLHEASLSNGMDKLMKIYHMTDVLAGVNSREGIEEG